MFGAIKDSKWAIRKLLSFDPEMPQSNTKLLCVMHGNYSSAQNHDRLLKTDLGQFESKNEQLSCLLKINHKMPQEMILSDLLC